MSLNAELTNKVKNAVKAKLVEIGAYVDDQLSDYVMIMITNKKTEKQMTEDLELFLGGMEQSANFSQWLHSYIKKLTSAPSNTSEQQQSKKQTSTNRPTTRRSHTSTVTAQPITTHTTINQNETDELAIQIDSNEFNDDFNESEKKNQQHKSKKSVSPSTAKPQTTKSQTPTKNEHKQVESPESIKTKTISSKVIAVSAPKPVQTTVAHQRHHERIDEDDDLNNIDSTRLSSVIKVTDRKYNNIPKSMQPNKSILLNALDAANKSSASTTTSTTNNRVKSIADEKLALIRSKRFGGTNNDNSTKPEDNDNRNYKRIKKPLSPEQSNNDRRQTLLNEHSLDADFRNVSKTTSSTFLNTDRRQVQIKDLQSSKRITVMNEKDSHISINNDIMEEEQQQQKQPKFIVTLNGLNEDNFFKKIQNKTENKRTLSDMEQENNDDEDMILNLEERIDDDELMDNDDENQNLMDEDQKTVKKLIRCTFWPTCDKGEKCPYLHPNKPCSAFPSCTFGQQCHYLHPSCRYDGFCTRLDCAYTHVIKKPAAPPLTTTTTTTNSTSTNVIAPIELNKTNDSSSFQQPTELSPSKTTKSTPKITINKIQQSTYSYNANEQIVETNLQQQSLTKLRRSGAPNVPYYKSAPFPASQYALVNRTTNPASVITTPCKYGNICKNIHCIYTHPNLPQMSQLKWTAALQNSTNTQTSAIDQTTMDNKLVSTTAAASESKMLES